MKAIQASKLYRSSKRKARIDAAMLAQSNLALMQQLAEDLDEEYQVPENLGETSPDESTEPEEADDLEGLVVDEEIDPEKDLVTMEDLATPKSEKKSSPAPKAHHSSESKPEKKEEEPAEINKDLMPDSPMLEEPTSAEASTQVHATTLSDLTVLKGTLNSRAETAGVNRIGEKENELWIYYNDDVNLNDIMVDVIEYLTTGDYQQLEFNRLARSDNAIVFVKSMSTPAEPESVEPEEDKK